LGARRGRGHVDIVIDDFYDGSVSLVGPFQAVNRRLLGAMHLDDRILTTGLVAWGPFPPVIEAERLQWCASPQ